MLPLDPGEEALLLGERACAVLRDGILRVYPSPEPKGEPLIAFRLSFGEFGLAEPEEYVLEDRPRSDRSDGSEHPEPPGTTS